MRYSSRRPTSAHLLAVLIAVPACTPPATTIHTGEDANEDATGPFGVKIEAPVKDSVVGGTIEVRAVVTNPPGGPATRVTFQIENTTAPGTSAEIDGAVPSDGRVSATLDTTKAPDGKRRLRVAVVTPTLTASTIVEVLIDNLPPEVAPLDPTPPNGSKFLGDLPLRFEATDKATGVASLAVTAGGVKQWAWDAAGKPRPKVDTDDETANKVPPIELDTTGWVNKDIEVMVVATDAAGHESAPLVLHLRYVCTPTFVGGTTSWVPGAKVHSIARVRLKDPDAPIEALAAATEAGVRVLAASSNIRKARVVSKVTEATGVTQVEVADMNGDGLEDIVTLGRAGQEVTVGIHYQDKGAFKPVPDATVKLTEPANVSRLAVGRLNGDPWPDVVILRDVDEESLGVSFSLGDGSPAWSPFVFYGGVPWANLVTVGQFSEDDLNDVLVARANTNTMTLYRWDAQGKLVGGVNTTVGGGPDFSFQMCGMFAAPLISGSEASTAVVGDSGKNSVFLVQAGKGGEVQAGDGFGTGLKPVQMAGGDIDEDGNYDVAVYCENSAMVTVYWGDGAGSLAYGPSMASGGPARDVALADWNGDGHLDVVTVTQEGYGLDVMLYEPERRFVARPMVVAVGSDLAAGRFVAPGPGQPKGLLDLAVLAGAGARLYVADPGWKVPMGEGKAITMWEGDQAPSGHRLAVGDIDGNGYDDLVMTTFLLPVPSDRRSMSYVLLDSSDPKGSASNSLYLNAGPAPFLAQFADVDGKLLDDLVVVNRDPGGPGIPPQTVVSVFPSAGTRLAEAGSGVAAWGERGATDIATGDLDGKKGIEAVISNKNSNDFTVVGVSPAGNPDPKHWAAGLAPSGMAVADLDEPGAHGGLPDVITLLDTNLAVSYGYMDGGELKFEPPVYIDPGPKCADPVALVSTDMNGDGLSDLVVVNRSKGTVAILVNLAGRNYSPPFLYFTGVGPTAVIAADLTGDHCTDLATLDSAGKTVTFFRNAYPGCDKP